MFEKFNLIHFEIARPLVHDSYEQFDKNVKSRESSEDSPFSTPEEIAEGIRGASFCITGSFDMLLPSIRDASFKDFSGTGLQLTGFCVMNNGPDYYTRRSHYQSLLVSYTYSGVGCLTYKGRTYTLTSGRGFVIDCREPYEYSCLSDHWEHADIHIWGEQAVDYYQCFLKMGIVTFSYSVAAYTKLLENLLEAYTNHSTLRSLYVGDALLGILCAILKKAEMDGTSNIPLIYKQIVSYLESNYMQPLTLDDLAAEFHVSKYHMSREFRKYIGYAPGDYLIMLRIQHAEVLLTQSDLSIESIAIQSGFGNMSNFIQQIKKRTGLTPSDYRKRYKGEY